MKLQEEAISLLKTLIQVPSFSREENVTAERLQEYLHGKEVITYQQGNNIWAKNDHFDPSKKTILLNSHHDTVKPNQGYTKDPFSAIIEDGKLYGLGSNDAGGALVSLLATFLHFKTNTDLNFNILFAASAEEEISGKGGIESTLPQLGKIDLALVGEPTQMHLAVAEKGLMVLDCTATGTAGHAARDEGENAIYNALEDIQWFKNYTFQNISTMLGAVKMTVTQVNAGSQHNVVPDQCSFVVDTRVTDAYSLEDVLEIIRSNTRCEVSPRSVRLQPSGIAPDHPVVQVADKLQIQKFGSPTLSDQALMPFPSVKIGPGDSARSHTADEFIYVEEITSGIELYIRILEELNAVGLGED